MIIIRFKKEFVFDIEEEEEFYKAHVLYQAATCGKIGIVKLMLTEGVDPSSHKYTSCYKYKYPIEQASKNGHLKIVEILLKDERIGHSLYLAVVNNHYKVVKLLLDDKRVNPGDGNNCAIRKASEAGHHKIVKLLLDYNGLKFLDIENDFSNCETLFECYKRMVDPSAINNQAIISASEFGHYKVVKLLLGDKRVNPAAQNNAAIKYAYKHKHYKVVELLSEDKRVDVNVIIKTFT